MERAEISGVKQHLPLSNLLDQCKLSSQGFITLNSVPDYDYDIWNRESARIVFDEDSDSFLESDRQVYTGIGNRFDIMRESKGIHVPVGAHLVAFVEWKLKKRLVNPQSVVLFQVDAIAGLGGFWAFVNGTFVVVFGANIIYFLFRSRPLSALGLVHIFQCRTLERNWQTDFSAIHTEGGQPGTENAGIVAFIRERLVDLDEDELRDAEAAEDHRGSQERPHSMNSSQDFVNSKIYSAADTEGDGTVTEKVEDTLPSIYDPILVGGNEGAGSRLDAIPLMDFDLGMGEVLLNTTSSHA
ncbi:hypothetical protein C8J57DRAFT_1256494 [Mycena rebaudengoi]|nr:hypothetical protein C8J57DRAFT_1256494 [Mycena rebaudengoi]